MKVIIQCLVVIQTIVLKQYNTMLRSRVFCPSFLRNIRVDLLISQRFDVHMNV
jgi:hypothetical protein